MEFLKILSTLYINGMFKQLTNFVKSENGKWICVVAVVLIAIWLMMSYSNSKGQVLDTMYAKNGAQPSSMNVKQMGAPLAESAPYNEPTTINVPPAGASEYSAQPVANPSDLLPKDENSQWASLNPIGDHKPILPDLLQAGNLIGLDTIGQTLKNPNLQLRSDPTIQKVNVGPWNNSTYEPDLGRVPLELGCA